MSDWHVRIVSRVSLIEIFICSNTSCSIVKKYIFGNNVMEYVNPGE